ncbi:hypothetical protein [Natronosalvus rutilus]|uniref:Uncharacterized protein n=1 Tax=Natronosalvus rutilus TaxID=2953753 RepID=A0A9E7NAN4_9EURY|nr:hypothetical protein [Natronosalvus rutilus]UTF53433.1 hypothetical protein NGM29_16950 [Natronosalvus rutilus]
MPKRITDYREAGEKTQMAMDYCALNKVVPRKSDDPYLPESWKGIPSSEVREGMEREFGTQVASGTGTYMWQRIGADHDIEAALSFLQERREELLDGDLQELAGWK